jgi:hypothetical protein
MKSAEEIALNALKIAEKGTRSILIDDGIEKVARKFIEGEALILKKGRESISERNLSELLSSLSRMGVEFSISSNEEENKPQKRSEPSSKSSPLEEIYTEIVEKEAPCIIEPSKKCVNCGGRCRQLGF